MVLPGKRATVRAIRLLQGRADLIDYSAVRVKKRETRDSIGRDL